MDNSQESEFIRGEGSALWGAAKPGSFLEGENCDKKMYIHNYFFDVDSEDIWSLLIKINYGITIFL